jgi:NAD(P)-dependent dehydrogenase (short-subunit alcohol dehydrogenase family)
MTPPVSSLFDLSGRAAIVTGASKGIGRGIARRFAEAGADVAVFYREDAQGAAEAVKELGGRAFSVRADLSNSMDVARAVAAVTAEFGKIDILVNNAGIYPVVSMLHMAEEELDGTLAANLKSVHLMTQAVARGMIERAIRGAIVNITSIEAFDPAFGHAHYNAAKAGVHMYTKTCALELGRHGIRVNSVAPGLIDRPGLAEAWPDGVARYLAAVPLGRLGTPSDVADACLFLASDAARWITGASLTADGGVTSTQSF